jgi:hypothetical protein
MSVAPQRALLQTHFSTPLLFVCLLVCLFVCLALFKTDSREPLLHIPVNPTPEKAWRNFVQICYAGIPS